MYERYYLEVCCDTGFFVHYAHQFEDVTTRQINAFSSNEQVEERSANLLAALANHKFEHGFRRDAELLARLRISGLKPIGPLPIPFLGNFLNTVRRLFLTSESGGKILSVRLHCRALRRIRNHRSQGDSISRESLSIFLHCAAKHQFEEFVIGP
jgi:hypothetical protein